ncbi:MAG TPA: PilZ domain-containing protein [Vicinamibacterales bacterium]|nr:PilZ domain-containing protein [Vicinamibacterales bacterium]
MIYGFRPKDELATLSSEMSIRVLNCGASGCLIETQRPLPIGRAATLQIKLSGAVFEETVQVVRCQEITGGSGVYHVGTRFLNTTPATTESLRYLFRREVGAVGASLVLSDGVNRP